MSSAMSAFNTFELTQSPSAECRWLRRGNEREIPFAYESVFGAKGCSREESHQRAKRLNFREADFLARMALVAQLPDCPQSSGAIFKVPASG